MHRQMPILIGETEQDRRILESNICAQSATGSTAAIIRGAQFADVEGLPADVGPAGVRQRVGHSRRFGTRLEAGYRPLQQVRLQIFRLVYLRKINNSMLSKVKVKSN